MSTHYCEIHASGRIYNPPPLILRSATPLVLRPAIFWLCMLRPFPNLRAPVFSVLQSMLLPVLRSLILSVCVSSFCDSLILVLYLWLLVLRFRVLDPRIPTLFNLRIPTLPGFVDSSLFEPRLPPFENQRYCSDTTSACLARTNVSRETFPSRTSRTQRPTRQRNLQEEQPAKHATETMKRTSAKTEAASASADDDRPRYEKPAPLGTGARVSAATSGPHRTLLYM